MQTPSTRAGKTICDAVHNLEDAGLSEGEWFTYPGLLRGSNLLIYIATPTEEHSSLSYPPGRCAKAPSGCLNPWMYQTLYSRCFFLHTHSYDKAELVNEAQ